MTLTTLQAAVTKTAAFNGTGVDISTMTTPFSVNTVVTALTSGKTAIFALQSSADSFSSDIRTEWTGSVKGPISTIAPMGFPPPHEYDMKGIRVGVTSAKLRLALVYIDSASSVTYSSNIVTS